MHFTNELPLDSRSIVHKAVFGQFHTFDYMPKPLKLRDIYANFIIRRNIVSEILIDITLIQKEEAISPTKRNLKLSTMINLGGAAAGFPFR